VCATINGCSLVSLGSIAATISFIGPSRIHFGIQIEMIAHWRIVMFCLSNLSSDDVKSLHSLFEQLPDLTMHPCFGALLELAHAFSSLGATFREAFQASVHIDVLFGMLEGLEDSDFVDLVNLLELMVLLPVGPMAGFRWDVISQALREGSRRRRQRCFVFVGVVLHRHPELVREEAAVAVVEALLVALDCGKYRDKEACLMPLFGALELADDASVRSENSSPIRLSRGARAAVGFQWFDGDL
jgi:hypothetical protein